MTAAAVTAAIPIRTRRRERPPPAGGSSAAGVASPGSALGKLYTVDPETGETAEIAGLSVPGVDGIVVQDRDLWAVQGTSNQVTEVELSRDLTAGTAEEVITDDAFQTPSTAIWSDGDLAVVNAKFDTGFPPVADQYEVVVVDA